MNKVYTSLDDFADWELEAYADGEPLPHVAAFFAQHPAAYQAWQKGQQRAAAVKAALHRFDCPPPDHLRAYIWHELSTVARQQFEAHLQFCPHCAAELASLQAFLQADASPVPTSAAAPAARQGLWEQLQKMVEQVQLTIATLVTPTTPQLAGIALRNEPISAGAPSSRQTTFLFETETVAISLLVERTSIDALQVAGQLLSVAPFGVGMARITAADPAVAPQVTQVDDVGNFVFSDLPLGSYQIVITLPEQTIVIPSLNLA
jgi:anti-sigma factor RsiW